MPAYQINSRIDNLATPPIADVQGWIEGRQFDADKPLLDVSQAVPSYQPAQALRDHMAQMLDHPDTSLYTGIVGTPELRQALAAHLSDDYAGTIKPQQVAITAGCNQAFSTAIDALTVPNDEIVLPVPYYFNHQMWLEMRGLKPAFVHRRDGELQIDDIRHAISGRTRAVILVNPDNPTGQEYSPEFIGSLFDICKRARVALIIDETYKDFRTEPSPPHGLFKKPDWDHTFIHLYSFSKAFAVTGYRIGAMVAHVGLVDSAEKLLDCATICASHIGQAAALFALANLDEWRREKATMMKQRMAVLSDSFKSNELEYRLISSGAYFAYVEHPFSDQDATAVARRLADEFNILCLPGSMFGERQERCLRFAFANLEATEIPELVRRLIESQA